MSSLLLEDTTTMIAITLSDSERQLRGQELVAQLQALDAVAERKRETARQFKDESECIEQRIDTLKVAILTGVENYETPCKKVYDFKARKVYWQTDDGKRHNERDMRDDELGKATRGLEVYMADAEEVDDVI